MITRAIRNSFGALLIAAVAAAASGRSRAADPTRLVGFTGNGNLYGVAAAGNGGPLGVVVLRGAPPSAATSAETFACAPGAHHESGKGCAATDPAPRPYIHGVWHAPIPVGLW